MRKYLYILSVISIFTACSKKAEESGTTPQSVDNTITIDYVESQYSFLIDPLNREKGTYNTVVILTVRTLV